MASLNGRQSTSDDCCGTRYDRGIVIVFWQFLVSLMQHWVSLGLTFLAIFVEDRKIKICSITKATLDDDITFEFKYRDASTIKLHPGRLLLGLELVEHGGRHDVRL
jgi:hypothetical protein